jgi:3-hydroxy-9,10-secoandrosta-1,3,5(10)-triene-9,17-dione monooxygenase reductase component
VSRHEVEEWTLVSTVAKRGSSVAGEVQGVDELAFRDVLGQFATGVTIITANDQGEQVGMSANSFTSVSLDPPLVAFCAAHSSTTYPRIRRAGHFCVNVLSEHQADVARLFSVRGIDRFSAIDWRPSPTGAAIIEDSLAWVDCEILAEHVAGDHVIVVGLVVACEAYAMRHPLLYFRGDFGVERPESDEE